MKGVWAVYDEATQEGPSVPLLTAAPQNAFEPSTAEQPPSSQTERSFQSPVDSAPQTAEASHSKHGDPAPADDKMDIPIKDEHVQAQPASIQDTGMPDAPGSNGAQKAEAAEGEPDHEMKRESSLVQPQQKQDASAEATASAETATHGKPAASSEAGGLSAVPAAAHTGTAATDAKNELQVNQQMNSNMTSEIPASGVSANLQQQQQQHENAASKSEPAPSIQEISGTDSATPQPAPSAAASLAAAASGPAASAPAAAPPQAASKPRKKRKLFHAYMFLSSSTGDTGLRGETKVMQLGEQLKEMGQSEVIALMPSAGQHHPASSSAPHSHLMETLSLIR